MKKILIYLILLTASLSSCSGFLTEEPKLKQSNELTLSTFGGLDDAVAGAYTRFNSYSWYGASYVLTSELSGGNARNPFTYPGSGRYRIQTNWSYNENSTSDVWDYSYYTIAAANNVINNLAGKESSDVSAADVNNLMGEALFLRALCYHDLVTTYALPYTSNSDALGVPVVLVTENGKPARNTVKEVYTQITTDLLKADSLMSDTYARSGLTDAAAGVTKPAIEALLSRVYLYMGQYQKSADYATKVINSGEYSLTSGDDYLSMFTENTAVKGGEVIFEMYSSNKNEFWDGSGWEQMSFVTSPSDNSAGSADVCASEDLINLFSSDDIRLQLYELKNAKDWFCLKYAGKTGSSIPKENNTIILRLSEMYLNRAEAIYNGAVVSGVTAISDLATLAAKRGTTASSPSKTSILNERRKELAFEGHIFYDLKRTQTSLVRTDKAGVNMDGNSKRWALPIPKAETDANPNCKQNEY
jgi:tetratricopeptide (TPR) repeat protein